MMTVGEARRVLGLISYKNWRLHSEVRSDFEIVIQWDFWAPDYTMPGQPEKLWSSAERVIELDATTPDSLAKAAFILAKQAEEHETLEAFMIDGVAVFDPHKPII